MSEPWIQTYTGRKFKPQSPSLASIDLRDIAHSLALQCRFTGHCSHFYSVAQHSVLVSLLCEERLAEATLWGLMHDAAEAYVSDLARPLKRLLPDFSRYEERVAQAIVQRFEIPRSDEIDAKVAWADDVLLVTEARDLMKTPPDRWQVKAEPLTKTIQPWPPERAEQEFLSRCEQVQPGILAANSSWEER